MNSRLIRKSLATKEREAIQLPMNSRLIRKSLDTASTSESASTFSFATVFPVTATTEGGASSSCSELVFFAIASLWASGRLLVGCGHNFIGKSQVCSEVVNSGIGQVAVVVLPAECDTDELPGFQRLHQTKDLKVGGSLDLRMSRNLP